MLADSNHFNNLPLPLYPDAKEVSIYEQYIKSSDTVLLLGYTKQLINLSTKAIDLNPINDKIIKQDWFSVNEHYDVIIGDGVLNLVGGELVTHLSKYCNTLIIRFFTDKIEGMKYATYFKSNTSFLLPDIIIDTNPSCKILIWNCKQ
jgi:hypothetical protein